MASSCGIWDDPILHAKLAVLVLIGVLVPQHIVSARTPAISAALVASSVLVVLLGVELMYG